MLTSAPVPSSLALPPAIRLRPIALGALGLTLVVALGLALEGEAAGFVMAGVPAIILAAVAVLARLGTERRWARAATLVVGGLLVGLAGLALFAISAMVLLGPDLRGQSSPVPGAPLKLLLVMAGLTVGGLLGLVGLVPRSRRALAAHLPFDPTSFPAGVAVAAVLAGTVMPAVPLLVLATPPVLAAIAGGFGMGNDGGAVLREQVYSLIWLLPAAAVAAGWGLGRDRGAVLARLGMVRPTGRQVLAGLGLAIALTVASQLSQVAIGWLWTAMGWPHTDSALVGQMFGFALTPVGALVLGVTAGLGEEVLVRGLLQPRVGMLLANLFFTSVHALQYNWDALLMVFLMGTALGLIRRRTNTTTSALVHGAVDALLILSALALGTDI